MTASPGYTVPRSVVEEFITKSAQERGIDPRVALEVYRREGAGGWQSSVVKNGVREPSYGPFQLYTGGGLGNKFQSQTGLDPSDPNTWQQNVNFALDEAKKGGWGPWYGAKAAGITGFTGIDGNQVAPAQATSAPMSLAPPMQTSPAEQPGIGGGLLSLASALAPSQQPQSQTQPQTVAAPPTPPPRRVQTAGLLQLLQNAPPSVRGLLLRG